MLYVSLCTFIMYQIRFERVVMRKNIITVLLVLVTASFVYAKEYDFVGDHNKKSPIYQAGEEMVFTVKFLKDGQPMDGVKLKWVRTGDDGLKSEGVGFSSVEGLKISASTDQPGFVRVVVTAWGEDGKQFMVKKYGRPAPLDLEVGACVGPETLQGLPEPEDFDEFWNGRKKYLAAVPLEVLEMVEVEGNEKVVAYDVKIACAGSMPVSGYLTMPRDAKEKSLPAVVSFHGYGIRSANKNLGEGARSICLDINAHGIENGKPGEYYKELGQAKLKAYGLSKEGNLDQEKTYFHDMMLRVMRSLEYVKSLPQWNGEDLKATGGSQGGMQSLIAAGLDSDVTSCYAWSPWNCDIGRRELGREMGSWGLKYTPALEYYDPINHVKRAHMNCQLEIVANLGDYVCPPSGVWIAFNNWPGQKKMEVRQACQHGVKPPSFSRFYIEED